MNMEVIIEQMKKISLSEDPLPLLIEMKNHLIAISNRDVVTMFEVDYSLSHIQPLFDVLNSSSDEQISMCVDVLNHILTKINPRLALENFIYQYLRGLNHPNEKVRLLILRQILVCSESTEATQLLLTHPPLLLTLISRFGDSSMEVVKVCHKTVVNLCSYPSAARQIFTDDVLHELRRIVDLSDSYRYHVYDVSVKISLVNDESLRVMLSSGILNQLVGEIFTGDILTQLNALELVSELAVNSRTLTQLKTDGIVAKLSYLLSSAKSDQMAAVLLPGLLKFFGHLGAVYPHILAEEETLALREIMRISCDFSGDTEISLQLIAFETLAHIGSTIEGKNALKKFSVEMEQSLKDFSAHISSFPSEMKVRILEALSKLFYLPAQQQTEDLLRLLETWFEHLSEGSSMNMVYGMAKQPFPEILCAVFLLMQSLALLPWGLGRMAAEPGLLEWLLDRDSCKDKENKELRYNIIATIHSHNITTKNVLDEEMQQNMATFYNQGPFYVESEPSITFEREH